MRDLHVLNFFFSDDTSAFIFKKQSHVCLFVSQ